MPHRPTVSWRARRWRRPGRAGRSLGALRQLCRGPGLFPSPHPLLRRARGADARCECPMRSILHRRVSWDGRGPSRALPRGAGSGAASFSPKDAPSRASASPNAARVRRFPLTRAPRSTSPRSARPPPRAQVGGGAGGCHARGGALQELHLPRGARQVCGHRGGARRRARGAAGPTRGSLRHIRGTRCVVGNDDTCIDGRTERGRTTRIPRVDCRRARAP